MRGAKRNASADALRPYGPTRILRAIERSEVEPASWVVTMEQGTPKQGD
jgi:hypothetical protein